MSALIVDLYLAEVDTPTARIASQESLDDL